VPKHIQNFTSFSPQPIPSQHLVPGVIPIIPGVSMTQIKNGFPGP